MDVVLVLPAVTVSVVVCSLGRRRRRQGRSDGANGLTRRVHENLRYFT